MPVSSAAVWQRSLAATITFGRAAIDCLLPPQCLACDQPVEAAGLFCAACFVGTGFITPPFCERCAEPAPHAGYLTGSARVALCRACLQAPPAWDRARAALRYDTLGRQLVLRLKHADRLDLARPLARLMARAGADLLREAELVVPVPLHRRRLLARRYNQAALLAREVAALAGRPAMPDALCRTRATVSLGHLGRAARAQAVLGAFAVRPRRAAILVGRRVLLVDDVLTTGATAGACAEALLLAGAAAVDLLVAARVPHPRTA